MAAGLHRLPLEKPIYEIEDRIASLEAAPLGGQQQEELRRLKRELVEVQKKVFGSLDPWQTVEVSRHPNRPKTSDYLDLLFDEFVELHGDKSFGDDRAMLTGFAKLDQYKVLVIGHQKGKTLAERQACHFGCAHPEGYRKAMQKMRMAEKWGLPIVTFINTPGAYPGIGAEERGQASAIARNILEMFDLKVPVVCIVIGEGGSGGALGIGVGDRVGMLENSYYSVISPEGCAAILWKAGDKAPEAADSLKLTSKDLLRLGLVDKVIDEPLGGAHRDQKGAVDRVKAQILEWLGELAAIPVPQLLERRYEKFRRMGQPLSS